MPHLQDAGFSYSGRDILKEVDLDVAPGSFYFLTDPSGAGKSTFLRLCYQALLPTPGTVRILDRDVRGLGREDIAQIRRRIGVVHQDCKFIDHMTMSDNIRMPLQVSERSDKWDDASFQELMSWVGLTGQINSMPHELSSGERQRAALTRAVIMSPDLILAVMNVLETTSGIASARLMTNAEQRRLLEPWFGLDLPLDSLPVPRLVEIVEENNGPDMEGLRQRLSAQAPGAVLDDHTRWRRPLVNAAKRLRTLGMISSLLIAGSMAAMITLAAQSVLAANGQVISVLRLVGARDVYIARAFVHGFTVRTLVGAAIGTFLGMAAILLLSSAAEEGAFLTGPGFKRLHWLLPLAAIVAFLATRFAALRALARIS